jgi:flagellar FliL protein
MAMALINIVLSAVIIFVIVPTSNKTNKLVSKVAQIIDLELESPDSEKEQIAVSDIETYQIQDKLTIRLKANGDDKKHYAIVYASLSINKKHKDYEELNQYVAQKENEIKEIFTDEFSAYTIDNVDENKNLIKERILSRIQDLFKSDFIINVSFGNLLYD